MAEGVVNPGAEVVEVQATPLPSSETLQKISEKYSHIPPSPGADSLLFADGTLGDIMAAEFGDLSVQTPPPSQDLTSPPDADASSQNLDSQEIEPFFEEPSKDPPEIKADLALSSSSSTPPPAPVIMDSEEYLAPIADTAVEVGGPNSTPRSAPTRGTPVPAASDISIVVFEYSIPAN